MKTNHKTVCLFVGALALAGLVSSPAWSGHGHHGKFRQQHFLHPGVMKTVMDHAGSAHRREIRGLVRKFRSAKKEMAGYRSAETPNKDKIAETRKEIDQIKQELSQAIDKIKKARPEVKSALERNQEDVFMAVYLMRHEERLGQLGEAMGKGGKDFVEDFSETRQEIIELRKKIKGFRAGVDYGKIDKARKQVREAIEEQQKHLRKAFSKNPQLRADLLAELKEMRKSHKKRHHKKNHHRHGDEGSCSLGEECGCDGH